MSDVIIHGLPMSSYARTALMVCTYKSIPHELQPFEPGSSEHLALHPFGRVPAMSHGDVHLFETLAIAYYLEEAFDGEPLFPEGLLERSRAVQWVSAINDYIYQNLIIRCASERFVKPMFGKEPDEAAIAEALPTIRMNLDVLDTALSENLYLAGDQISLPDLFLAPILRYFAATPEGESEVPARTNLMRWNEKIRDLPGYSDINALG